MLLFSLNLLVKFLDVSVRCQYFPLLPETFCQFYLFIFFPRGIGVFLFLHPAQCISVCTTPTVPSPLSPPSLLSSMACFLLFPSPHYLPPRYLPIHNPVRRYQHRMRWKYVLVFTCNRDTFSGFQLSCICCIATVLVHTGRGS